jgi:hypothetical protein
MQQEKMALQCYRAVFSCCEMNFSCCRMSSAASGRLSPVTARDSPLAKGVFLGTVLFHFTQAGLMLLSAAS